jgi:predicted short-subunit dehydrogenase-like oxidoreductase (DUF2520 family)
MAAEVGVPPRLRVGVIGVGRVGAVLGAALRRVGHHVVGVHGRSDISRVRAEALLPGVPLLPMNEVAADCDLLVIAVADDAIAAVVEEIQSDLHMGQYVLHVSGRHGLQVLASVRAQGALPLAVHPVMTFTGTSLDLDRLEDCPFAVTADPITIAVASALVIEMGGAPIVVDEGARSLYHAALTHGANHLITVVGQTMQLLRAAGVSEPEALTGPLLRSSLDNALRLGDAALTGPVARGDVDTVSAHLEVIAQQDLSIAKTYAALAAATAERAQLVELLNSVGRARVDRVITTFHSAED